MKKLLVTFVLGTLLAAETLAAGVGTFCQEETGRFTYIHSTAGKVTGLTQAGLDSLRKKAGESITSAEDVEECTVPIASVVKDWFTQFISQLTSDKELGNSGGFATGTSAENEKAIHQSKNGDFEALLIMTQDPELILNTATGAEFTMFEEIVSINIGEAIEALLLFRGCSVNPNGDCLVTADYMIEAPDGSTYQKALNTQVWNESGSNLVQYHLTNTRMGFLLQPDAEAGIYKVDVTVSDKISDTQLSLRGNVEANAITTEENDKVQPSLQGGQSNLWHESSPLEGISVRTD